MKHLKYEHADGLGELTLANPPQNRLGLQMLDDFEEAVDLIGQSGARALVVRGDGPDFSWGGYFPEWIDMNQTEVRNLLDRWLSVYTRIERFPFPVVAAVQGACWGGGFELALRCDIILATRDATFNHPEPTLAITTLLGGVYRLAERAGKHIAAELAYTAKPLGAETLHRHGVVNHIVPAETLLDEARRMGSALAKGPTLAHAAHKTLLRVWESGGLQAADEALLDISMPLFTSEDTRRALRSAAEALAKGQKRPFLEFNGR